MNAGERTQGPLRITIFDARTGMRRVHAAIPSGPNEITHTNQLRQMFADRKRYAMEYPFAWQIDGDWPEPMRKQRKENP